jgi:hypothetical protein
MKVGDTIQNKHTKEIATIVKRIWEMHKGMLTAFYILSLDDGDPWTMEALEKYWTLVENRN